MPQQLKGQGAAESENEFNMSCNLNFHRFLENGLLEGTLVWNQNFTGKKSRVKQPAGRVTLNKLIISNMSKTLKWSMTISTNKT